jgi:hypothetical protein
MRAGYDFVGLESQIPKTHGSSSPRHFECVARVKGLRSWNPHLVAPAEDDSKAMTMLKQRDLV